MNWLEPELREIGQVVSGYGFPIKFQGNASEEFPFFKVGDMNAPGNERCMTAAVNTVSAETLRKLKAKVFPKGTVIFPKIGAAIATNKKRMLVCPSVVDNNVMGITPSGMLNEWYLYYWMQQFDLRSVSNIGPVPSMRKSEVERVRMPLPPPMEQSRIVELLDQADALRKKRAESDFKTDRILPTLFYNMFGDPAAKAKGWESGVLSSFGARVRYGLGQPPPVKDAGVALIRATNVKRGIITEHNMIFVDPHEVPASRNAFLQAEEVLVVRSGAYTGDVAQVGERWAGSIAGYDLVINPGDQFTGEFISALLLTPFIQTSYFGNVRHRGGQPHLNATQLEATPVIAPPKPLQEQFSKLVRSIRILSEQSISVDVKIESLFAVLLYRAFTGNLTTKWREAHIKELLAEMELQAKALDFSVANKAVPAVRLQRTAGSGMLTMANN